MGEGPLSPGADNEWSLGELTGASEDVAKRIFHPITVTNSQSPGGDPWGVRDECVRRETLNTASTFITFLSSNKHRDFSTDFETL